MWHQFFTIIAEAYPHKFDEVETVITWPSIVLLNEINKEYDERRFSQIKRMADAQILSHKDRYYIKNIR